MFSLIRVILFNGQQKKNAKMFEREREVLQEYRGSKKKNLSTIRNLWGSLQTDIYNFGQN